jgi:hypothetical protein
MAYPAKPASTGLSIAVQAGVGAGVSAFALIIFVSIAAFFWKIRSNKKYRKSAVSTTVTTTPVSRISELYQPPNNPRYPQGAFDRDQERRYAGAGSPVERSMSVSPPEAGYRYGQGHNPQYPPQQGGYPYAAPVPTRVPVPRPGLAPVPPQGLHATPDSEALETYHSPVAYGLPPEELSGESFVARGELQDQRWPGPNVYEAPGQGR